MRGLAAAYVSDKGAFEGAVFSFTYGQKNEQVKAFTANYISVWAIKWQSIFGIEISYGRDF